MTTNANEKAPTIDELAALTLRSLDAVDAARAALDPDAIDRWVADAVAPVRATATQNGLLTGKAIDQTVEAYAAKKKTERLMMLEQEERAFSGGIPVLEQQVDEMLAVARHLSIPRGTPIDRMATFAERAELRATFAGQSVAELAALYRATPDTAAPEVVAWIEQEARDGFRTLKVSTADALALNQFLADIRAREEARIPPKLNEIKAAIRTRFRSGAAGIRRELMKPRRTLSYDYRQGA